MKIQIPGLPCAVATLLGDDGWQSPHSKHPAYSWGLRNPCIATVDHLIWAKNRENLITHKTKGNCT